MTRLLPFGLSCALYIILTGCSTQPGGASPAVHGAPIAGKPLVGGGCDGCELMYTGMPPVLHAVDTSSGWTAPGQQLVVSGTVYQAGGSTPASGVIIYYWQTDNNGYYTPVDGMDDDAKKHGHIRGWVKTGPDGKYAIYTIRPAPYPNDELPAHIHFSVKEPGIGNEYYVDDLIFEDDPLLGPYSKKYPPENRGGSGVVRLQSKAGVQYASRDIVLGLNIPHYPAR